MDALQVLQKRISSPLLKTPGPDKQQLEQIFLAALRAPDHGALQPWRFLVIEGDAREKFGDALHKIKIEEQAPDRDTHKAKQMPLRAPTIIVVVASIKEHPKIPEIEQEYSAATAAQNIILAAEALDLGAIWRTGWPAFHKGVNDVLGLGEKEKVIGFIYIGTREMERRPIPELEVSDFVKNWE